MARDLAFDVTTLTMGEAAEAEMASGHTIQDLLKAPSSRLILAVFVHELRNSGQPRSWREISNLRLLDARSSISQLLSDGPSETSSDSPSETPTT